ncbi:MAG: hotdog domain-containing protein [Geothrix sp.]|nr:hotdog domain-containing protein [Geothrix sp.]
MVLDMDIALNAAMFGGDMMARMDKVAGIAASLMSRNRRFLTVKVSELIFHSPVRAGEIIEFHAAVARQGRTSLTLDLEVQVYEPQTEARRDVTSGEFVMVAVDEALHPEPVLWKPEMVHAATEARRRRKG